jgi:DNA-binding NarL/FixJ family response regulator
MLRDGRHIEAIAHAERAAAGDPELEFRALAVGGRAAHLSSREVEAMSLYQRAEAAAKSEAEVRDANWGRLVCMIDLELPSADAKFAELSDGVGFADPREVVRAAGHGIYLQLRRASLDLEAADMAYRLLPVVNDPLVQSSFLSAYANALVLSARYEDALVATSELLELSERYRLDFALAYGLAGTAMAHTGLRQWRLAEDAALRALTRARSTRDVNADLVARAVLLRLYAQQGQVAAALSVDAGRTRGALNSTIGEFAASRALVLACAGRTTEARELIDEVRGITRVVELVVLSAASEAVCALRDGRTDVVDEALALESIAFQSGAVDLLVTSYRACPELLSILLRTSKSRRFRALVELVGDDDLASATGYPIAVNDDRRLLLTPREKDVFNLLRTGLSNREIGRLLYIEESTVKAHTHRIYEKLGVHSRSALVIQAALERGSGDVGDRLDV